MCYCCADCFSNDSIKKYIHKNYDSSGDCDYCGTQDTELISVRSLGFHLCDCIEKAYESPDDGTGAMWSSEDKCYLGPDGLEATIYTIREILADTECIFTEGTEETSLLEDLFSNLYSYRDIQQGADDRYSDVDVPCLVISDNLYGTENTRAYSAWATFKHINNHYSRFFETGEGDFRKQCLERVSMYLYESIRDVNPGEVFYRLRLQDDSLKDIQTLDADKLMGPPPAEYAKTNRMSPAGIPYLYLASDVDTTIKECRIMEGENTVYAKFVCTNILQVIDLSEVPTYFAKSIFDEEYDHDDCWIEKFLKGFIEEISKPVDDDYKDHSYEYAATQVVAEFFRNVKNMDGICFKSSVGPGKNYVFFVGPDSKKYERSYPYPFGDPFIGHNLSVLDSFNNFFRITELDAVTVNQNSVYSVTDTKAF